MTSPVVGSKEKIEPATSPSGAIVFAAAPGNWVVVPFRRYLERQNVPVEVISTPLQSYGESANAVRFDARELIRHYRIRTGEEAVQI